MTTDGAVPSSLLHPVEVRGLTIKKGDHVLLQRVAITLEKGVFAALVGPSGCGKTSLLRVMALLDKPASGRVFFGMRQGDESTANSSADTESLYPMLNYVPQTIGLWPHMTIRENLLFATPATPQVEARLWALCDQLEIAAILDLKPQNASQGQRQRSALVRALLLEPQVLLLDEVTAALDGRLASTVWNLLRQFVENGRVILASTHDPRLASQCDRSYRICETALILEHQ